MKKLLLSIILCIMPIFAFADNSNQIESSQPVTNTIALTNDWAVLDVIKNNSQFACILIERFNITNSSNSTEYLVLTDFAVSPMMLDLTVSDNNWNITHQKSQMSISGTIFDIMPVITDNNTFDVPIGNKFVSDFLQSFDSANEIKFTSNGKKYLVPLAKDKYNDMSPLANLAACDINYLSAPSSSPNPTPIPQPGDQSI